MESDETKVSLKVSQFQLYENGIAGHSLQKHSPSIYDNFSIAINNPSDDPDTIEIAEPYPDYAPTVFKCLSQSSIPRCWVLKLISSHWFEKFSLFVIIVNCITMGMYKPCEVDLLMCVYTCFM